MKKPIIAFWRIAAYTFLALCGAYAWVNTEAGWRQYVGLAIFILGTVRILAMAFPQKPPRQIKSDTEKADRSQTETKK